ncbi:MAG: sirohydrochlorin cobaltochelatase [archaeon]|nr:sirohydrochlorin cobaltochelatase [archaeon]
MTKRAILIIGHGSRYEYNEVTIDEHRNRLENRGYENVYIGFNETSHPFIGEAMIQMAKDGIEEVVAIPFFITAGRHTIEQIPKKLGLKDNENDTYVEFEGRRIMMHYGDPFGDDPVLAEIIRDRINEARTHRKIGILVIGHGSRLPYNKRTIEITAQRLMDMGFDNVRFAFNEFDKPCIEDEMRKLMLTDVDEILVTPLFISLGDHLKNDVPTKIDVGTSTGRKERPEGKSVKVKYLQPIGRDIRLTEAFVTKIEKYYGVRE